MIKQTFLALHHKLQYGIINLIQRHFALNKDNFFLHYRSQPIKPVPAKVTKLFAEPLPLCMKTLARPRCLTRFPMPSEDN